MICEYLVTLFFIKGFLRPGNLYWKDLHDAIEGSKVILTIRDNEHVWCKSWMPFIVKELNKHGIFRLDIFHSRDLFTRIYASAYAKYDVILKMRGSFCQALTKSAYSAFSFIDWTIWKDILEFQWNLLSFFPRLAWITIRKFITLTSI